jgi:hypothetical protein
MNPSILKKPWNIILLFAIFILCIIELIPEFIIRIPPYKSYSLFPIKKKYNPIFVNKYFIKEGVHLILPIIAWALIFLYISHKRSYISKINPIFAISIIVLIFLIAFLASYKNRIADNIWEYTLTFTIIYAIIIGIVIIISYFRKKIDIGDYIDIIKIVFSGMLPIFIMYNKDLTKRVNRDCDESRLLRYLDAGKTYLFVWIFMAIYINDVSSQNRELIIKSMVGHIFGVILMYLSRWEYQNNYTMFATQILGRLLFAAGFIATGYYTIDTYYNTEPPQEENIEKFTYRKNKWYE